MNKKLDFKILITTIISLLPMLLGVVNNFSSNLFLTFAVPIIFAIINVFVNFYLDNYDKTKKTISVTTYQCRWIIPMVSIVYMSILVSSIMKIESSLYYIIMSFIGTYVCSTGVKLLEFKDASNTAYKVPVFLNSHKANSEKFDFIGYMWIITGIAFISLVYLRINWLFIIILLCIVMFIAPFLVFKFMIDNKKQNR